MNKLYLMDIDSERPEGTMLEVSKTLRAVLNIPMTDGAAIYKRALAEGPQLLKEEDGRHQLADDQWQLASNPALMLRNDPSEEVLAAATPAPAEDAPDETYETYDRDAVLTAMVIMSAMDGDPINATGMAGLLRQSTKDGLYDEVIRIMVDSYVLRIPKGDTNV